ncbi:MAG: cytidylate kinase-like family protein [Treponema sp.]|jgi:cytidylate kinase|nr:cytidylate kinase-like family protein [Treponema sp.]
MNKQLIVSIGREYGSGGHKIAKLLAEKLDIPLYNRNILEEVAGIKNVNTNSLAKYDEAPRKRFFSRTVRGYTNSPEENVAELQFNLLKSKFADEDSFVIVGRCADELFYGYKYLVTVFITGDEEDKIKRIMESRGFNEKQARKTMERHDKMRKAYHDYFCKHGKWGETDTYDLCLNASRLSIEDCTDIIYNYIQKRLEA